MACIPHVPHILISLYNVNLKKNYNVRTDITQKLHWDIVALLFVKHVLKNNWFAFRKKYGTHRRECIHISGVNNGRKTVKV